MRGCKLQSTVYVGRSDVIVICGHITISMLWGNTSYSVNLSGENLLPSSNKIASVGLRKCPYDRYLTKKYCHNNKRHGAKTAGIDMVIRNCVTVTLCTCTLRFIKKSWQYIYDYNSGKTRLIFWNNFCTAVSRKNIFTHTWKTCSPHLNNVLTLPCESETWHVILL